MIHDLENLMSSDKKTFQNPKLYPSPSVNSFSAKKINNDKQPTNFFPNDPFANLEIPKFEPSKCSVKKTGIIKCYAANTHHGLVRNYNEDRVAIILNIVKPAQKVVDYWPNCSFFGIYDGHGGSKCAEFLRDNLHHYVVRDQNFPVNPQLAIKFGFAAAEKAYIELALKTTPIDKSGSCAIIAMLVGNFSHLDSHCYIGNVGDSRAVLSSNSGAKYYPLSNDHKPSEESERKRITEAGGKIYQLNQFIKNSNSITFCSWK